MRQLFLPVCFCLATWTQATGSDPGVTFDEFNAKRTVSGAIGIPHAETASVAVAIPGVASRTIEAPVVEPVSREPELASREPSLAEIGTLIGDLAAEHPVPSGVVVNNGIPAGLPLPPIPKPVVNRSEEEVCGLLKEAARHNDVPAPFFIRLLFQESRFNPGVVSSAGAQGIAQFMPGTADHMGVDNPFDPLQAIPASARLLRDLVRQFGNLGLAAAAYNAGPKRVADWLAAKGKAKLPEETQGYVKIITGKPVENWSAANANHAPQKLPKQAPCQDAAGLLAWNGPDSLPLPQPSPLRDSGKVASAGDIKAGSKAATKSTTKIDADTKAGQKKGGPAGIEIASRKSHPKNLVPKRQRLAER